MHTSLPPINNRYSLSLSPSHSLARASAIFFFITEEASLIPQRVSRVRLGREVFIWAPEVWGWKHLGAMFKKSEIKEPSTGTPTCSLLLSVRNGRSLPCMVREIKLIRLVSTTRQSV